jgi:hypothetical protein
MADLGFSSRQHHRSNTNEEGGGQHAVFKKRVSAEVVGEFVESFVGASWSEYSVVLADYAEISATNFERRSLTP